MNVTMVTRIGLFVENDKPINDIMIKSSVSMWGATRASKRAAAALPKLRLVGWVCLGARGAYLE